MTDEILHHNGVPHYTFEQLQAKIERDRTLIDLVSHEMTRSEYVRDWPDDEREYFRHGDWASFAERSESLARMRAIKLITLVRNFDRG